MGQTMHPGLATLAVKIAGLVIIAVSLIALPNQVLYVRDVEPAWLRLSIAFLPTLFPLAAGFLMTAWPNTVAKRLMPRSETPTILEPAVREIETAALGLLGFYLLARSIGDMAFYLGKLRIYQEYLAPQGTAFPVQILPEDIGGMVATAVEFLLAILFILAAPGLVQLRRRLAMLRTTTFQSSIDDNR